MNKVVPLTEKAARLRLIRLLEKKSQILVMNRQETPAYKTHGRYMILDELNNILACSATLTPWLEANELIKSREYVLGEE